MNNLRSRVVAALLSIFMIFVLVGCSAIVDDGTNSSAGETADTISEDKTNKHLKIAMCLELPNIDFYTASKAGGIDAAAEDGNAEILWLGSEDVSELLNIIEQQIDAGIDGLCIQASNPASLITAIDKANAAGIPCVVFNNTMEYDGYDGCVGMDPAVAGEGIGKKIESILSGNDKWSTKLGIESGSVPEGKIAFFLDAPGAYNLEGRKEGVMDVLGQYSDIEDIGSYDITSQGVAYAMEVVKNVITANPDIKVLCSVCSDGTSAIGLVIEELGLGDQVLGIGMDTNETTLSLVKSGVLPVAFNQDPYSQGYLPVKQIIDYIRNGTEIPKVTSTELITIGPDDVDEFLKLEESFKETVADFGK